MRDAGRLRQSTNLREKRHYRQNALAGRLTFIESARQVCAITGSQFRRRHECVPVHFDARNDRYKKEDLVCYTSLHEDGTAIQNSVMSHIGSGRKPMRRYLAGNLDKSLLFLRDLHYLSGLSFQLDTPGTKLCLCSVVAVLRISDDRKNCDCNGPSKAENEALHVPITRSSSSPAGHSVVCRCMSLAGYGS